MTVAGIGIQRGAGGDAISILTTTWYRYIGASALAVSVVVTIWLAATHLDAPVYLLLVACNLLMAWLFYLVLRKDIAASPSNITLQQAVQGGGVVQDLDESELIAIKPQQPKEEAETISRTKSDFVAMMSHEIRTPMNAVLGMADLLRLTDLTRKQQDYVRTIQSSGTALLSLVDNVLDYSELRTGALIIRDQPFNVRKFVESILEIMGFQAYLKGLELGCRVETDVPLWLNGDEDRLRQVMVNLIGNGVRYSSRGEVTLRVRAGVDDDGEASWICTVTDTGVGISPEVRDRLFDPLARNDDRESIGKRGSGLGLTVCKWLVESMGGSLKIDSEVGRGTQVSFEFSLESEESAVTADESSPEILQGLRALVMHGNDSMASIIGEYLSDYGMSWDACRDGAAGLQRVLHAAADGTPYDVLIIDASLPEMDGLSVAHRVRAESSVAELPIILLTPIAYPLKVGEISSIGGIRCINKPVLPTDLGRNLGRLLATGNSAADSDFDPVADTADHIGDLRILIAEDNDISRQLLQNMLASLKYDADTVVDGPSALKAMENEAYDVVLMDCQMPGIDGDEVTRRVRNDPQKYRAQPVIVAVTADVSAAHRAVCRDAGMDDFLAKPVRRWQLVERLRQWREDLEYLGDGAADASANLALEEELRAQLKSRGYANDQFLSDYIDLFLADTNTRLDLLDAALAKQDWGTVRRQSHALKGACMEMGASAMSRECARVHDATQNGDAANAPSALHDLRKEFFRVQPVFEAAKRDLN